MHYRVLILHVLIQARRRGSSMMAGKQGFITLRDLFRWAERYRQCTEDQGAKYFDFFQLLADNGMARYSSLCLDIATICLLWIDLLIEVLIENNGTEAVNLTTLH